MQENGGDEMKLWILEPMSAGRPPFSGYDVALGFVVRARAEDEARGIAATGHGDEGMAWLDNELTTCRVLTATGQPCVIMRDFNAG